MKRHVYKLEQKREIVHAPSSHVNDSNSLN